MDHFLLGDACCIEAVLRGSGVAQQQGGTCAAGPLLAVRRLPQGCFLPGGVAQWQSSEGRPHLLSSFFLGNACSGQWLLLPQPVLLARHRSTQTQSLSNLQCTPLPLHLYPPMCTPTNVHPYLKCNPEPYPDPPQGQPRHEAGA